MVIHTNKAHTKTNSLYNRKWLLIGTFTGIEQKKKEKDSIKSESILGTMLEKGEIIFCR